MSQNRPTISAFLEARKVKTAIAAIALSIPTLLSAGTPGHDAIGFMAEHYKEIKCLARVIYHETRGEPHAGKLGVAAVAINRTKNPEFPDTVCEVIKAKNAFPWHARNKTPYNSPEFAHAKELAYTIYTKELNGERWKPAAAKDALFFNTVPFSYKRLVFSGKIGGHMFYNMKARQ